MQLATFWCIFTPSTLASIGPTALPTCCCWIFRPHHGVFGHWATLLWITLTASLLSTLHKRKRPNAQTRSQSLTSGHECLLYYAPTSSTIQPPSLILSHSLHSSLSLSLPCKTRSRSAPSSCNRPLPSSQCHLTLSSPLLYLYWSYLDLVLCMQSGQWIPSEVLQPCSVSYILSWQSTARLLNSN